MSGKNFLNTQFFSAAMAFCFATATASGAASGGIGSSQRSLKFRALPNWTSSLSAPVPANAPSVFAPDKGKLRITINGQQVGSEDFEIAAAGDAWLEHSTMTAHAPGSADVKSSGQLRLSADGSPMRYDWSAEALKKATGSVNFENGTAKCSADLGNPNPLRKDFKFTSPVIAVLDNNLYYQFAILARIYDWKTGGKQTFPVLIPQDM